MRTISLLTATGIVALFSTGLHAADAVIDVAPLPAESPRFDWSGAYIGLSGGFAGTQLDLSGINGTSVGYGDDGFLIGGTVGYNYQFGNFVAGVEADISYADIGGRIDGASDPYGFGFVTTADASYFATARARLGYAFDRTLIFGTGGAAFSDLEVVTPGGNADADTVGYTVGGGLEYAFSDHFTAKAEYLYADFGSNRSPVLGGFTADTSFDLHVVRIGMNYKF